MRVVFVHGWSVTNTNTYGELPQALVDNAPVGLALQVQHLYLGKYVSFSDEVMVDDIARGLDAAIRKEILPKLGPGERFGCITHSTGGPVVRAWIHLFYRRALETCPLGHLVMLAPANHGSALAQLGKGKLARMKFFLLEGVQPGTGVLDWLELGSEQSWELNKAWLDLKPVDAGLFPFVLTGQTIDREFYDNLNSYTGEAGSDGVVRVAAANMNYGLVKLEQQGEGFVLSKEGRSPLTALGVLPGLSHSGKKLGIMRSVTGRNGSTHETVKAVLQCLQVSDADSYKACMAAFDALTKQTQEKEKVRTEDGALFLFDRKFKTPRFFMLVFRVIDDRDNELSDYNIVFTAGPGYDANHLPENFFKDRQRNSRSPGKLTYFLNYDVMDEWFKDPKVEDKFGFEISARPDSGYAYYTVGRHQGTFSGLKRYFAANQTVMIEVVLKRQVMEGVFQLTQKLKPSEDFRKQPKGDPL